MPNRLIDRSIKNVNHDILKVFENSCLFFMFVIFYFSRKLIPNPNPVPFDTHTQIGSGFRDKWDPNPERRRDNWERNILL